MSQRKKSNFKLQSQDKQQEHTQEDLATPTSFNHEVIEEQKTSLSNDATKIPINPEHSEKKVDGRRRGLKSAHKKLEHQQNEIKQMPKQKISVEKSQYEQQEPQMVNNTQRRPEAKEDPTSSNTTISQDSKNEENNEQIINQKHQYRHSSITKQDLRPVSQEPKTERPISIDINKKIWSMCKFDASLNGCRSSSQDCRFVHLDLIEQAVLSDSKKLAKLAVINWDLAKLSNKYHPNDRAILNQWANSDSNERNPLFIKYKTMMEEKDTEFAKITQDLKAEEMELEDLKNAFYIKKQRYMSELSSRLRQGILSKSRQKAFNQLIQSSAQRIDKQEKNEHLEANQYPSQLQYYQLQSIPQQQFGFQQNVLQSPQQLHHQNKMSGSTYQPNNQSQIQQHAYTQRFDYNQQQYY